MPAASVMIRGSGVCAMSNVIPFRKPEPDPALLHEIDLFTAVDAAIRDLRDIAQSCDDEARQQADECRRMLERAFRAAVGEV
jgi:hypothetical protein